MRQQPWVRKREKRKKALDLSPASVTLALTGGEIRVKPLSNGASHKTPSAVPHLLPRGSLFLRFIVQ